MSIFNNFSYKLFGIVVALFYCAGFGYALAGDPFMSSQIGEVNIDAGYANVSGAERDRYSMFAMMNTITEKQIICPSGYYLSSCNQIIIGTNWLKGVKGSSQTPDYYSYDPSDSDSLNVTNLRKFFTGLEPINYTNVNGAKKTVLPSVYTQYRNLILTAVCAENEKLANIECKKCPNDAKVLESSVELDGYSGEIIKNSWQVHTFTDCYMDEFSDHTGTYIYIPASASTNNYSAKKCYYSNTIEGSELVSQ